MYVKRITDASVCAFILLRRHRNQHRKQENKHNPNQDRELPEIPRVQEKVNPVYVSANTGYLGTGPVYEQVNLDNMKASPIQESTQQTKAIAANVNEGFRSDKEDDVERASLMNNKRCNILPKENSPPITRNFSSHYENSDTREGLQQTVTYENTDPTNQLHNDSILKTAAKNHIENRAVVYQNTGSSFKKGNGSTEGYENTGRFEKEKIDPNSISHYNRSFDLENSNGDIQKDSAA